MQGTKEIAKRIGFRFCSHHLTSFKCSEAAIYWSIRKKQVYRGPVFRYYLLLSRAAFTWWLDFSSKMFLLLATEMAIIKIGNFNLNISHMFCIENCLTGRPIHNAWLHSFLLLFFLHKINKVVSSHFTTERLESDDTNEHYWQERGRDFWLFPLHVLGIFC